MSIGNYYGKTTGAVARYSRSGSGRLMSLSVGCVDRNPPEGANWLLQFRPSCQVTGPRAKSLAARLSVLAVSYQRKEIDVETYMQSIDQAVAHYPI